MRNKLEYRARTAAHRATIVSPYTRIVKGRGCGQKPHGGDSTGTRTLPPEALEAVGAGRAESAAAVFEGVDVRAGASRYRPGHLGEGFFVLRGRHRPTFGASCAGESTEAMQSNIKRWMEVSEGAPSVIGMMYTTWRRNYSNLEEFFRLVAEYPAWVENSDAGGALSEK